MIDKTAVYWTDCQNPHENLALEDHLLHANPPGQATLFLWQNRHTVVIGAGQNAWRECHTQLLAREGGTLARRSSGGGAVYHDLGNLNFSFIVPRADYDVARQLGVVLAAVRTLGISAEPTGRNDLTVNGKKFSGNAFRLLKDNALHHGTLLVSVDFGLLGRYLNVSPSKLAAKGVKSVPARVVNLSSLADVDIKTMGRATVAAFARAYGEGEIRPAGRPPEALYQKYASWEWNYGSSPQGDIALETRFPWGGLELFASLANGAVAEMRVYTDAMDETLAERLQTALRGCPWRGEDLARRAEGLALDDVAQWLITIA